MNQKNDKQLCWNCDGGVSQRIMQCPYCGVDLTNPPAQQEEISPFKGFASPFQEAQQDIPKPPYANTFANDYALNKEEWNQSLEEESDVENEGDLSRTTKREMIALLLLLPGVVFFLFGLALVLFSHDGILSLEWNQSFAYFYFLGAVPLLFLGWRALR